MKTLKDLLDQAPIVLDGATGTMLQSLGMKTDECPEIWILNHKEEFVSMQKEYVSNGSRIIYAPSFTANRHYLKKYGLDDRVSEINIELVKLSKEAASNDALVAGNMTMLGKGLSLEDKSLIYTEQAKSLSDAGVNLFVEETMIDINECKCAVNSIKDVCNLPIIVSMTYEDNGQTYYGIDPETEARVLTELGVDAIGVNCSSGPKCTLDIVKELKKHSSLPILAKPSAGLPRLINREYVYELSAECFAEQCMKIIEAGASLIGGCCGTTPQHIKELTNLINKRQQLEK